MSVLQALAGLMKALSVSLKQLCNFRGAFSRSSGLKLHMTLVSG